MLNVLLIVALLLILANLFLVMVLFFLFFRAFFKFIGEDTLNHWNLEGFVPKDLPDTLSSVIRGKKPSTGADEGTQYTPTEGVPNENEVPLDQFTPDPNKPVTIKYEEAGEDHGMSVEEEK